MSTTSPELLKVSATTKPELLAGAIASIVRNQGRAELHAVGAAAVNQAVKAVAIARGYVISAGIEIVCVPSFVEVEIGGEERTGIRLMVTTRG